jgi:hypothetical protein
MAGIALVARNETVDDQKSNSRCPDCGGMGIDRRITVESDCIRAPAGMNSMRD